MALTTWRRWLAAGSALVLTAGLSAAGSTGAVAVDSTSKAEKQRVDPIETPKLNWYECAGPGFDCATARVPRDYDKPKGAKVEIALLRAAATDRKHKIGTLFVNPGGPGGSAVVFTLFADFWASPDLRARFDIVGMDPRGIGYSDNVRCFPSPRQQANAYAHLPQVFFPYTASEDKAYVRFAKRFGRACSSTGRPLSASMSTAEVARDLDLMRRAVGDKKLSYLGFSYGSYLGEVYANMFPDRFRALAIDGVIDPAAWVGSKATQGSYTYDREKAAEAGYRALHEILVRCDRAGGQACPFATGNPVKNFDLVAQRLKKHPLVITDPDTGEQLRFTYSDLIGNVYDSLYYPDGGDIIAENMAQLIILTEPPAKAARARVQQQRAAATTLLTNLRRNETGKHAPKRFGFPYANDDDAFYSVMCTDGSNSVSADDWPAYAAKAEKRVTYFGRMLASDGLPCSGRTWTAKDEDAYRGPFNRATAAPVLVVGDYWDPITNYDNAVRVARTMPNARLLASDSWGHTAYGTSECVTSRIDAYLISARLPKQGTVCKGDIQPFANESEAEALAKAPALVKAAAAAKRLGNRLES